MNLDDIKSNLKDIKIIDGLVNCAGIVPQNDLMNCSKDEWDHTLNTNLTSVFFITQYFMKIFLKSLKVRISYSLSNFNMIYINSYNIQ